MRLRTASTALLPVLPVLPVLLVLLVPVLGSLGSPQQVRLVRLEKWVKTGFQYLKLDLCLRVSSLSEGECRRLSHLQLSGVAVYVSEPGASSGNSDKVLAILPDSSPSGTGETLRRPLDVSPGSTAHDAGETLRRPLDVSPGSTAHDARETLRRPLDVSPGSTAHDAGETLRRPLDVSPGSTAHDAVLLLDPSPGENFGHPVVLFYVDVNVTKKRCSHLDGVYLGEECLTVALKSRCQNQLKRHQAGPERLLGNGRGRLSGMALRGATVSLPVSSPVNGAGRVVERSAGLCEVHFLPLVVGVRDANRTQRLRCVEHPEFARCPQPLPSTSPSLPVSSCELNKNTRRCHQQALATHLSCRLYQTCDHAVLISGGWQQMIMYQHHVENLQRFYRMLRINGFHRDHINTFFSGNGQLPEEIEGVYPATEKHVIRNHVSYICRKQHCADSLVLYLNSPTRSDGAMLLWDGNLNGIADLKERYSVNELLADLAGCRARRVLVFVDQSYSGVLSKRLRGSLKHPNVVLVHSPTRHNQNQNLNHNPHWDHTWTSLRPRTCLLDHLGKGPGMTHLLEPWASLLNVTLSGAPCNATPPLTEGEMRREYQGCQNLPTALWYQRPRNN